MEKELIIADACRSIGVAWNDNEVKVLDGWGEGMFNYVMKYNSFFFKTIGVSDCSGRPYIVFAQDKVQAKKINNLPKSFVKVESGEIYEIESTLSKVASHLPFVEAGYDYKVTLKGVKGTIKSDKIKDLLIGGTFLMEWDNPHYGIDVNRQNILLINIK